VFVLKKNHQGRGDSYLRSDIKLGFVLFTLRSKTDRLHFLRLVLWNFIMKFTAASHHNYEK